MTEHSIEELERQLQAADDRSRQAYADVQAAKKRLQDARNEASGILGHVLEYTRKRGWGAKEKTSTIRIVVDKVTEGWAGPNEPKPLNAEGYIIVASGAIGQRRGSARVGVAADKGPHVPGTVFP